MFVSVHAFLNVVHFQTLHNLPPLPLLWWLNDDDTTWWIFSFLQNSWNFCEIKFMQTSDIISFGSPFFANNTL